MERKIIFLFFIAIVFSLNMFGQIDNNTTIKTDFFAYDPDEQSDVKSLNFDADVSVKKKVETTTSFGSIADVAKNFPKYSVIEEKTNRMMLKNVEIEKDVLVKKYWNGKDVSNIKVRTKLELGRIDTNTKSIRIECRDHSYVDGDRVRISVNEIVVRSNIVLKGGYYTINITLNEGFNRVDIEALNQGTSGPNTAEFKVYDEKGNLLASNEWNILTGYVATLVVIKN